MSHSRRQFLKTGAGAVSVAALSLVNRPLMAQLGARPEPVPPIDDPRLKTLVQRGVDVARQAGADYADVRLTFTRRRQLTAYGIGVDEEMMTVGVRALVHGYWGFASGPIWSPDEMARLGREAVLQARVNTLGKERLVALADVPVVRDEHWTMPVAIDPFDIYPTEIQDYIGGLAQFAMRQPNADPQSCESWCEFMRQEKAFGATNGTYCSQRTYRTKGTYATKIQIGRDSLRVEVDSLTPAGAGWELIRTQPLRDMMLQAMEEGRELLTLPVKPVDVGRYDVVIDARGVAQIISNTVGAATELDRTMGFEANSGGTSYVNDPVEMLGTLALGSPLLNVTADRSMPQGAATVKWDDEGVAPESYTLVKDGILADYSTTRESAGWLAESYAKRNTPVKSHGCAYAPSAVQPQLTRTPNLTLAPAAAATDQAALIATVKKGMFCKLSNIDMDFQQLNGLGMGTAFEIKNGKLTALVPGASILFRAPELWKGVTALGGSASARRYGIASDKGEPPQTSYHSAVAVPMIVKALAVIDALRKA